VFNIAPFGPSRFVIQPCQQRSLFAHCSFVMYAASTLGTWPPCRGTSDQRIQRNRLLSSALGQLTWTALDRGLTTQARMCPNVPPGPVDTRFGWYSPRLSDFHPKRALPSFHSGMPANETHLHANPLNCALDPPIHPCVAVREHLQRSVLSKGKEGCSKREVGQELTPIHLPKQGMRRRHLVRRRTLSPVLYTHKLW
jgi:hypothetical protein